MLRQYGVEPDAVGDVAVAWRAFGDFLQVELDGLAPAMGPDADGFIVQWGRWSWHQGRLSMALTRQLAVPDGDDEGAPDGQPALWQVELTMLFADAPALTCLETGPVADTGFRFTPIGPRRAAELEQLRGYAPVRAVWNVAPVRSALSFDRAD
jgi:hypothetical protein